MKCIKKDIVISKMVKGLMENMAEVKVKRVKESVAKIMVEKEGWQYCSKSIWKKFRK